MKFKKTISIAAAAAVLGAVAVSTSADSGWQNADILKNAVTVNVNGTTVEADNFLYNDTTYLPIRAVSESLGLEVAYDTSTSTASLTSENSAYDAQKYKGKKVLVLGDSNSALSGTSLTDAKADWKHWFSEAVEPASLTCVAVGGATLCDKPDTVYDGNPYYNADDQSKNTFGNQVQKIINNQYDAPDAIIILYGMNDGVQNLSDEDVEKAFMKSYTGYEPLPLSEVDRTTYAGAFRYVNETLRNLYPNAVIAACTPIQQAEGARTYYKIQQTSDSVIKLARRMSLPLWDTGAESGIYAQYGDYGTSETQDLGDGLHTNGYGAQKLGRYIAGKFIQTFGF
jgi:lysophospholipase L1-like esterase